jgi:hypothetical protein
LKIHVGFRKKGWRRRFFPYLAKLFQFDGPVGMVEELLPASVSLVAKMDVIAGGQDGRVKGDCVLAYRAL